MGRNVREHLFSELHHKVRQAEIDALHLPEFTLNSIKVIVILVKKVVPVDGHTNFLNNLYSKVLIFMKKSGLFLFARQTGKANFHHENGGVLR